MAGSTQAGAAHRHGKKSAAGGAEMVRAGQSRLGLVAIPNVELTGAEPAGEASGSAQGYASEDKDGEL